MKEMTPYPASLGSGSAHTGRPRFCCGRRIRPGPVTQAEGVSFPQHWPGPSPSPPHPGRRGAPPPSRALSVASRYVFNNLTSTLTRQVAAALPSSPI